MKVKILLEKLDPNVDYPAILELNPENLDDESIIQRIIRGGYFSFRTQEEERGGRVAVSIEKFSQCPHEVAFRQNVIAFEEMLPRLLQTHAGKFVPISNGKIVDSDSDEDVLSGRCHLRKDSCLILVIPVEMHPTVEGYMSQV